VNFFSSCWSPYTDETTLLIQWRKTGKGLSTHTDSSLLCVRVVSVKSFYSVSLIVVLVLVCNVKIVILPITLILVKTCMRFLPSLFSASSSPK